MIREPLPTAARSTALLWDDDLAHCVDSLIGFWRALASATPGARVVIDTHFAAARFPAAPTLDHAVLWKTCGLPLLEALYSTASPYAVWTRPDESDLSAMLINMSYRRDVATTAMIIDLGAAELDLDEAVVPDADPAEVAMINRVEPQLLTDVPGLRAFVTRGQEAGLVLLGTGTDVHVSMVATCEAARRRGLATRLVRAALTDARAAGYSTASLVATPAAKTIFDRIGFRDVARWQQWVRTPHERRPSSA